jgi:ligand-binding sensor domain-containing protein
MDMTTGAKTFFDKTNCPLPDNWIADIVVDSGIKWFATHNTGIARFDGVSWTIYDTSNAPLPGTGIQSIAVDSSHNLWIRTPYTNGGLIKFDGTHWTTYTTAQFGDSQ